MNNRQLVGIVGIIMLFIGAFSPMLHIPIRGSITYIGSGKGDGILVLFLALLAAYYLWKGKYRLVRLTAFLTLGILSFSFINVISKISDIQKQAESGISKMLANSVYMEYGFAVVLSGVVLLVVSSYIKDSHNDVSYDQGTSKRSANEDINISKPSRTPVHTQVRIVKKPQPIKQKVQEEKYIKHVNDEEKQETDKILASIQSAPHKIHHEHKTKSSFRQSSDASFLKKHSLSLVIVLIIVFNVILYFSGKSDNDGLEAKYEVVKTEISNSYEDQRGWGKASQKAQIISSGLHIGKMVNTYSDTFTHPVPAVELSVKNIGIEKLQSFGIDFEVKDIDNKRRIGGTAVASGSIDPGWSSSRHILALPDSYFAKLMGGDKPIDFRMSIDVYVRLRGGEIIALYNKILDPKELKLLPTIKY